MIGIGLEPRALIRHRTAALDRAGIPRDYVLYLGRVDRNKGCATLLEYFQEYIRAPAADHAGARGTVDSADSRTSAHPRARLRRRRSGHALLSHARALSFPRPTKASASSCSRRGITACRRWSTHTARCSRGRCAARTAGCPTARRANSRKRCRGCSSNEAGSARTRRAGSWRMSIANTGGRPCSSASKACCEEVSRRRSAPPA